MGITPDRQDGPSIEEELQLTDEAKDPSVVGAIVHKGGEILAMDSSGIFNLRSAGGTSGPAGGDLKGTYPNPTVDKIEGKDVGDLSAIANGQVLRWDQTAGEFQPFTLTGAANAMQVTCREAEGSGTTYETIQKFIYAGSILWGTIDLIEALAWTEDASRSGDIRILDSTNSLVICELLGFTNTSEAVLDLGTISNVPTAPAVFEVQLRRLTGPPITIHCETVALRMM